MAAKKTTKKTAPKADAKGEKPAKTEHGDAKPAPKKEKVVAPVAASGATEEDKVMLHLKLHGKEFVGKVISDRAHKTVTVEWERRRLVKKFERYERRFSRVYAHNPVAINARMGDIVRIKETRPLSKTKNFVVVEVVRRLEAAQ